MAMVKQLNMSRGQKIDYTMLQYIYVIMYYIPILEDGHQDHQAINRNLYDVYPHS